MKPKFVRLFTAATEIAGGGGGASSASAAAVAEGQGASEGGANQEAGGDPPASQGSATKPVKASWLTGAMASFQDKGQLLGSLQTVRERVTALETQVVERDGVIARMQGEALVKDGQIADLQGQLDEIQQAYETAQASAVSTEQKALDLVAGLGIAAGQTPAAANEATGNLESLQAAFEKERDPVKAGKLWAKIEELEKKQG